MDPRNAFLEVQLSVWRILVWPWDAETPQIHTSIPIPAHVEVHSRQKAPSSGGRVEQWNVHPNCVTRLTQARERGTISHMKPPSWPTCALIAPFLAKAAILRILDYPGTVTWNHILLTPFLSYLSVWKRTGFKMSSWMESTFCTGRKWLLVRFKLIFEKFYPSASCAYFLENLLGNGDSRRKPTTYVSSLHLILWSYW